MVVTVEFGVKIEKNKNRTGWKWEIVQLILFVVSVRPATVESCQIWCRVGTRTSWQRAGGKWLKFKNLGPLMFRWWWHVDEPNCVIRFPLHWLWDDAVLHRLKVLLLLVGWCFYPRGWSGLGFVRGKLDSKRAERGSWQSVNLEVLELIFGNAENQFMWEMIWQHLGIEISK